MHRQQQSVAAREIWLLLLLGFLWGVPFALTKLSLGSIPPLTLTAARVTLAAMTLWIIVIALKRELPPRHIFGRLVIQACVGCVIPYTFIALGQLSVDSGRAAILNSSTPLFVYIISLICTHHERTTFNRFIGALVGLGGVVLIVGANALFANGSKSLGEAAILFATLSSAVSVIHGRRFVGCAAEVVAAGTLTCAAIMLIPISLLADKPWHLAPSPLSLLALFGNAVFATAGGFVLYFHLISTVGSMGTASTSYLKPVVSVLIGVTLLGEPFTPVLTLGFGAVLFGIAAINDEMVLPLLRSPISLRRKIFRKPDAFVAYAREKGGSSQGWLDQA